MSDRKKEDHDRCEVKGSLSAAQPELSASLGGKEGSLQPLLLGLLNSTTYCIYTVERIERCGDVLSSDKLFSERASISM